VTAATTTNAINDKSGAGITLAPEPFEAPAF
jgi:hypothetical protein